MARSYGRIITFISILVISSVSSVVDRDSNSVDNNLDSVSWEISEFGECSVECGGGIQVRTVRCVHKTQMHERDHVKQVPDNWCPQPTPAVTRSCNSDLCKADWATGQWSECSVTCGMGIQTREVTCQSTSRQGLHYHVPVTECGGLAPESSRKCHATDCPFSGKVEQHSILSENYTLIQLHRSKKIRVNVGGQVNIIPGQTVVVKCPVKHYSKKLVYWSKGYRLVHFMGRVRSTDGRLYIGKGDPKTDAGVYTCTAGDQTATITVSFIEKGDPSTKMYKKWIKKSEKQHRQEAETPRNAEPQGNIVTSQEFIEQRDQSHNSSHALTYVISDWSPCSVTCGSGGHRKRKVSCSHVTPKYVKIVPDSECQAVDLNKPETVQECSAEKKCAVWQAGPWYKCLPACGGVGHTSRQVTCVSESTSQPAGAVCDLKSKPALTKPCKTKPCPSDCSDSSRYCSLARQLKLCRFQHFQTECCSTCQALANTTS